MRVNQQVFKKWYYCAMQLHNTLSRKTEDFVPMKKGEVRMYHCGPTVYNYAHIGNLRAYVFADTLRRAFAFQGFNVKQVINITDVGHLVGDIETGLDKVEEKAKREKKTAAEIVTFYTDAFFDDLRKLNVNTQATLFPKATEHIAEQISLIQKLEKKGVTYKISDGIYFDTSLFGEYGKLGNIKLADLEEGARVAKNAEKKNPTDFALWKFSPAHTAGGEAGGSSEKRQQEWPSPWGIGFPGWHIECSAMAMKYLGETFDIHTGGIDHIPVHHNNEIAQSECATGKQYVHTWLHNEFINIEGAKMAKSSENFVRLASLEVQRIHPLAYRYWLLTAHYRTPILFSFEAVHAAQNALESLVHKISRAQAHSKSGGFFDFLFVSNSGSKKVAEVRKKITQLIDADLDTPSCIALLHKITDEFGSGKFSAHEIKEIITDFDAVLGLNLAKLVAHSKNIHADDQEKIKKLSRDREKFRAESNWAESDRIRKEIENMGFIVEDTSTGTNIRRPLSHAPSAL